LVVVVVARKNNLRMISILCRFSMHLERGVKQLCRLTGFVMPSIAARATRQTVRCTCLHVYRASLTRTKALHNLAPRLTATVGRHTVGKGQKSSPINFSVSASASRNCGEGVAKSLDADIGGSESSLQETRWETELDVSDIVPALPKKSFSLAAYVNESETLSSLVKLGANLSKIEERDMGVAERLIKLDFERDVKPVLLFLRQCDVKECDIGECITRNPHILFEPTDDMEVRVNYLESKRFTKESIAYIVSKAPHILTLSTKETDARLGYLQREFLLSGTVLVTVYTVQCFVLQNTCELVTVTFSQMTQVNSRLWLCHR